MKKSNVRSHSSAQPMKSYNTEQTLTRGICQNAFHNMLRSDNPQLGHAETKMTFVPIKVNKIRKVPTSHIFSGENASEIKVSKKKGVRYTPSNVLFNDDYFEKNPKINPQKKRGHIVNKLWQENKHMDGKMINSKSCKTLFKRRIDENYNTNPIRINTKEEQEMEAEFKKKLMEQYAEDEKLEQYNMRRRKQRELDLKQEVEKQWQLKLAQYQKQKEQELAELEFAKRKDI